MEKLENRLTYALNLLKRTQQILSVPANMSPEEWLLIATNLCSANQALQAIEPEDPIHAYFEEVMDELRDITDDFRSTNFLRSTRPARRHCPTLFTPGRS